MSLIFFALIHWPPTALHASGPKCWETILFEKISKFVKKPHWQPSFFSFVCGHEPDSRAPLPAPPLSKLTKQVFFRSYDVPHCVESNRVLLDVNLFNKPTNFSSLLKTLHSNVVLSILKVVFVLSVFCIQSS